MERRMIACGDRDWVLRTPIQNTLQICKNLFGDFILIHGACRGADTIAGEASIAMEMITIAVPAKWMEQGKRAGPVRNELMLVEGRPDLVLAFHDNIEKSRGTWDMVQRAERDGIPVVIIKSDTPMSQIEASLRQLK